MSEKLSIVENERTDLDKIESNEMNKMQQKYKRDYSYTIIPGMGLFCMLAALVSCCFFLVLGHAVVFSQKR